MTIRLRRAALFLFPIASCAAPAPVPEQTAHPTAALPSAPPAASEVTAPPTASSAVVPLPPVDPNVVQLSGHAAPTAFALDGDLTEWGSLATSGQSQLPGGSYLAIAVSSDAVLLGATLRGSLIGGIWLGLATKPAVLPDPYDWAVNGYTIAVTDQACEFVADCCPSGDVEFAGKRHSPDETRRCRASLDRHAKLTTKLARRYTRQFKLDASGLAEVLDSGVLSPVTGARASWKPGPSGVTLEASLPLSALPRMSEPALTAMDAWAGSATGPLSDVAQHKVSVAFSAPIRFEPHAQLRERLIALQGLPNHLETYKRFLYPTFGLSYQPGDPEHFEILEHRTKMELEPKQLTLYTKTASFGDIDVGEVKAPVRHIEISAQGKVRVTLRWDATLQKLFMLDGELIAAQYDPPAYSFMSGASSDPSFGALDVSQEPVKDLTDPPLAADSWRNCLDQASVAPGKMTTSPDFDTWIWKGSCWLQDVNGRKKATFVATWRWDKTKKSFVSSWQQLP